MSQNKHTPGPWFVTGRLTKYVEARIGGGLVQEVASCGPTAADNGYGDQQEANACLISAAPELLEALEELRELMQGVLDGDYAPDSLTLQVADAAIAKARGDQP